jgi:hypothetical protein
MFDAGRAAAASLMDTDRSQAVKELFAGLAGFCSTASDMAGLAGLSRDLVLMCSSAEGRVSDGAFYLKPLEGLAGDPATATLAAEAGHGLVESLAALDRIPEALDVYLRMARLPSPAGSDDWQARSAASIVTAYLEAPGAKSLADMEAVYERLLPLRDSPVVTQCRLFVATNILPFYLVSGDRGRISDVFGRISGSPDCTQTGLEMKLAASTNLVSYHAAGGRLDEAQRHFTAIDTDRHREPPFLQNWARAATALCAGLYCRGERAEAWLLASEIDRYRHDPEVEECLGRLRMLMGSIPPATLH